MIVSDSSPSRGSSSGATTRSSSPAARLSSSSAGKYDSLTASVSRGARERSSCRERGHEGRGDARHRADAQLAGAAVGKRGQIGARRLEVARDRVGVREQLGAGFGQLDRARAGRAGDQGHAHDPLERLQLLAHGRLGVAEPHGRAAHRSLARDRLQRRQVAQIEAGPFRKSADRSGSYPEFAARAGRVKWFACVSILVIQHDADKGLGLFAQPLAAAGLELDVRFAGHGELELVGSRRRDRAAGRRRTRSTRRVAVDSTREVLREALRAGCRCSASASAPSSWPRRRAAARTPAAGVGLLRGHAGAGRERGRPAGRPAAAVRGLPGAQLRPSTCRRERSPSPVEPGERCRPSASDRTRGACSSTPSRRSRCWTAGRSARSPHAGERCRSRGDPSPRAALRARVGRSAPAAMARRFATAVRALDAPRPVRP